jgi:hypothetical protein
MVHMDTPMNQLTLIQFDLVDIDDMIPIHVQEVGQGNSKETVSCVSLQREKEDFGLQL